jgi:RHS repeat-associated protein
MKEGDIYFYNARWYDPQLGRFMQADTFVPTAQGTQAWDRFAYVNNNPLRYTDPSGQCIFSWGQFLYCVYLGGSYFTGHVIGEIVVQNVDVLNQTARDRIGGTLITELSEVITSEANRTGISSELIGSVIRHESGALERRIFFNGLPANLAEGGEAYFRETFSMGSASIGIGQIQVSVGSMLEADSYVIKNDKGTISNLLNPKTAVGYIAGYLSYIRTNLVKEYSDSFTTLSLDDQSRIILQGYNMGITGLTNYLSNKTMSDLLKYQNYHRQTLDEYRRWRNQQIR